MILAILAVIFGYRKANATGRNGILWGAICGVAFIGTQFLVGIGAGGFIGFGVAFWGWDEKLYDDYSIVISIVAIVVSVIALMLLFRYLDRVPPENAAAGPPPPPTFHQDEQS
jgi:hypothetical protein